MFVGVLTIFLFCINFYLYQTFWYSFFFISVFCFEHGVSWVIGRKDLTWVTKGTVQNPSVHILNKTLFLVHEKRKVCFIKTFFSMDFYRMKVAVVYYNDVPPARSVGLMEWFYYFNLYCYLPVFMFNTQKFCLE